MFAAKLASDAPGLEKKPYFSPPDKISKIPLVTFLALK